MIWIWLTQLIGVWEGEEKKNRVEEIHEKMLGKNLQSWWKTSTPYPGGSVTSSKYTENHKGKPSSNYWKPKKTRKCKKQPEGKKTHLLREINNKNNVSLLIRKKWEQRDKELNFHFNKKEKEEKIPKRSRRKKKLIEEITKAENIPMWVFWFLHLLANTCYGQTFKL